MSRAHIIGAGLAGLSAAVELAGNGVEIILYEQAVKAGGRARSFHDSHLDREIDNGNHLLLSGNHSALEFLDIINARQRLIGPGNARFDFADLETNDRWTINFNRGPVPLWVLYEQSRVPGTSMMDYVSGLKLLTAGNRTVASLFGEQGQMYRRFWEPFSVAVLNTLPHEAVARLLLPVIRETLARGAEYSMPMVAKNGLSDTFVDPALKWLERRKADIRMGQRITGFEHNGKTITAIKTARSGEPVKADDVVVLATPPWVTPTLLEDITAPQAFAPIVNLHFQVEGFEGEKSQTPILGLVGSPAHWLFVRGDIISVTVSAAFDLADKPAKEIAAIIWPDVAKAYDLDGQTIPPVRVIKEQRATFKTTPGELQRRPPAKTVYKNLTLAGDWTDTGLPATIEGAIRSGVTAVKALES
ncbi:MAG TPA: FAD-binding protein [Rhizobiales bacterium]|nr:FAD-binding protein [Hyphomicrobiales bacterium]